MLTVYLLTIAIGSLGLGLLFDGVLAESAITAAHQHAEECGPLSDASVVVFLAMMAWFAWEDLSGWLRTRGASSATGDAVTIEVSGMTCGGCTGKLERLLNAHGAVTHASVSLDPGHAVVRGALDEQGIRTVIEEAGFTPGARV